MKTDVLRFPRTDDRDVLYVANLKRKYPPPKYNPRYDGGWNPSDGILNWLLGLGTKKLRKFCDAHALEDTGSRRKLIKRMYLHWRAGKLASQKILVGKGEWIGYGKGYESTREPTCHCGRHRRESYMPKPKPKPKVVRDWEPIRRFPRYPKGIMRFPRYK